MTGGSMFTGIGGFDEAMRQQGIGIAWMAEIEPFCRRVLAKRFPGVRLINDVREIDDSFGPIDLLCAGWPCQDLSVAGLRAGLAGERSGLFREVVRVLELLAPEWFLLENVPGLYSSYAPVHEAPEPVDVLGRPLGDGATWDVEEDSDFEQVLTSLTEFGYGVAWRCLDARYFDLAQRRERVLLVGCRGDVRRAAAVLFEPASCERHPSTRQEATPRDSAADLATSVDCAGTLGAANGRNRGLGNANELDGLVAHAVSKQTRLGGPVETLVAHALRAEGCDASEDGTGRGTPLVVQESQTGVRAYDTAGTLRSDAPGSQACGSLVLIDEHNGLTGEEAGTLSGGKAGNRMGAIAFNHRAGTSDRSWLHRAGDYAGAVSPAGVDAIAWDRAQITSPDNRSVPNGATAPTLAKTSQSMYGVRRLMPVECERLQGFPDGWTCLHDHPQPCDCPDTPRYAAIGNAVAVNVAEWVLGRLVAA